MRLFCHVILYYLILKKKKVIFCLACSNTTTYLPTPVTSTHECGGVGDAAIAWARILVVFTRLEDRSFL